MSSFRFQFVATIPKTGEGQLSFGQPVSDELLDVAVFSVSCSVVWVTVGKTVTFFFTF